MTTNGLAIAIAALAIGAGACKKTSAPSEPLDSAPAPVAVAPASSAARPASTGGGGGKHALDDAAAGTFGASCATGVDCTSGACAHGGRGAFCSIKCTKDSDCPEPPTGGRCKDSGFCNR